MEKILVSSCLLGCKVRYDASDKPVTSRVWETWQREGRLIPLCPELSAGFSVPRPPAEIIGAGGLAVLNGKAKMLEDTEQDVTALFNKGAELALNTVQKYGIKIAVLTDGSPSCGSTFIYDGTFSGSTKQGKGVVTALLERNGVKVFSNDQITSAKRYLQVIEAA